MSNPVLGRDVPTQAFASVVVTLPEMPSGRGRAGIMASIDKLREETRAAAFELGFAEGRVAGYNAGYDDGVRQGRHEAAHTAAIEAQEVSEALAREVDALQERIETTWQEFLVTSEQALTDRCLDTVRALLDAELQISRDSALSIVRRCLGEVVHATSIRIRVAADDLPYLEDHLQDTRVELVSDGSIDAGCIIESSSGIVDGTLSTSLQLLENAWDEAA